MDRGEPRASPPPRPRLRADAHHPDGAEARRRAARRRLALLGHQGPGRRAGRRSSTSGHSRMRTASGAAGWCWTRRSSRSSRAPTGRSRAGAISSPRMRRVISTEIGRSRHDARGHAAGTGRAGPPVTYVNSQRGCDEATDLPLLAFWWPPAGPAFAKDCRIPDLAPGVRAQLPPGCKSSVPARSDRGRAAGSSSGKPGLHRYRQRYPGADRRTGAGRSRGRPLDFLAVDAPGTALPRYALAQQFS